MERIKEVFSLNLICYLRCNGLSEKRVGFNKDTKKVYFVYEKSEELDRLFIEYKNKETTVRLHDFIAEFKKLKEDIYFYSNKFLKELK